MNLLQDIITYFRRIVKTSSNDNVSDSLIIDYINRFWIMDVDARIQLFDLKTTYQFQTQIGYDQYNMPLYKVQTEPDNQKISYYPMYQGFMDPIFINGIQVPFYTSKSLFFNIWPNVVQQMNVVAIGDGTDNYTFTFPIGPNNANPINTPVQYILRGHVDVNGVVAIANAAALDPDYLDPPIVTNVQAAITIPSAPVANVFPAVYLTTNLDDGTSIVVSDSGQFLSGDQNFGLLMNQGKAPTGNTILNGGYSTTLNTINYFTGEVNVTFPSNVPAGVNINAQCFLFQTGLPRGVLYNNNTITLRSPPDRQYLVQMDAYLTPSAYLATTNTVTFAYMCEYIARGAARKYLSDVGDVEQFQFYEPLFKEQEMLVWKRSQRQFTSTRTPTIYSQGPYQSNSGFSIGGTAI